MNIPRKFLALILIAPGVQLHAQYVDTTMWVPDYPVNCFAEYGPEIIMGGGFTNFARLEPYGSTTDTLTGLPHNVPNPDDVVDDVIADGNGGWFIGGAFTRVGTAAHNSLAHVDSMGIPYPWNPDVNGNVYAMAISGDTLFFGGAFTTVNGQPRNNAAAVLISTGVLTAWDPDCNAVVRAIALHGDSVFLGGQFTSIGGNTRNRIGLVDNTTGSVYAWSINLNNIVYALTIVNNRLYIGGGFSTVNTTTVRNRGACYDLATMTLTAWHPDAGNTILLIKEHNGRIFIAGTFDQVASAAHEGLAEVDPVTGAVVSPLEASQTITIRGIAFTGTRIYITGLFALVNGVPRENAADLDINTGAVGNWDPAPGREVYKMALSGSRIYLGGDFQGTGSVARRNMAAIDKQTGQLTSFDPNLSGEVNTMFVQDSVLYMGGLFASIGSVNRLRLGAIYLPTDTVTSWNPGANGEVTCMIYDDSVIYVGGDFTTVDGQGRSKVAAITYGTDNVSPWIPPVMNSSQTVHGLAKIDSLLYVGGTFTTVGGNGRQKLAAYHVGHNDSVASWNPGANATVRTITAVGNRLLIRGSYTIICGQSYNGLAMVDTSGSIAPLFAPSFDGAVSSYCVSGSEVFVSGNFSTCNGDPRNRFAAIDVLDAATTPIQVSTFESFSTMYASDGWLYLTSSGDGTINGFDYHRLARMVAPGAFKIKGQLWYDANSNGAFDPGELTAPYYPVAISSLSYTAFTDANGGYTFYVDSGSYSVAPVLTPYVTTSTPVTHNGLVSTANPIDSLNDFGLVQVPNVDDLEVVITTMSVARANTPRHYSIEYINHGSNPQNAVLTVQDDYVHQFSSASPQEDTVIGDTTFYFPVAIGAGQRETATASYVMGIYPVGTPVECIAHLSPVLNDSTPGNNHDTIRTVLLASLDPNFKEVFPSDTYLPLTTPSLEYVVHFQNTGNDTAIHIVLKDSLSPFLDPSQFTMLSSSHPCTFRIQNSILTVSYDSIMLVDSTTNEMLSHGFFHYRIAVDTGLPINTVINNTAYIFFDFNAPVITNTTVSILLSSVITQLPAGTPATNFEVFPVPSDGRFTIQLGSIPDSRATLTIFSSTGQLVKAYSITQPATEIVADDLSEGVYILRLTTNDGACVGQRKISVVRGN